MKLPLRCFRPMQKRAEPRCIPSLQMFFCSTVFGDIEFWSEEPTRVDGTLVVTATLWWWLIAANFSGSRLSTHVCSHIHTHTHTWTETTFRIVLWNASVVTPTQKQKPNPSRVQWKKRISSWCSVLMRQMFKSPIGIRYQLSRIQNKVQLPDWTSVNLSSDQLWSPNNHVSRLRQPWREHVPNHRKQIMSSRGFLA